MSRKEAGNIQAKLGAIQNRRGRRIFVVETLETVVVNGHCFLAQSQLLGQKLRSGPPQEARQPRLGP